MTPLSNWLFATPLRCSLFSAACLIFSMWMDVPR